MPNYNTEIGIGDGFTTYLENYMWLFDIFEGVGCSFVYVWNGRGIMVIFQKYIDERNGYWQKELDTWLRVLGDIDDD